MKKSDLINEAIDTFFDFVSSIIGNVASNIAPLLAGLLPSYLTYTHILYVLGFPPWVALAGAGVIEFIGLGAGNELMKVWFHNKNRQNEKTKMPILAPGSAAVWYVLIMITFNIILEAKPESLAWRIVSIALFATLAIPGYALVAGKTLRKEWESERSRDKAERKAERQTERQAEREREQQERGREDGANDPNSILEEEQLEYASAYAEQIESILERVWLSTGKVASPSYIVRVLNEDGARLDPRKSSGYISTLIKNWRISRGIPLPERPNGNNQPLA